MWDKAFYVDTFNGLINCFTKDNDRYGWLLNLINHVIYNLSAKRVFLPLNN
jgi:hypothetical protein